MLSKGAAPAVVQLAITLLLCLVPTIAFLGLLWGLERIRDDELIEQWAANNDESVQPTELNAFLAGRSSGGSTDGSDGRSASERTVGSDATRPSGVDEGRVRDSNGEKRIRDSDDESVVRCRHCGAPNPDDVSYCAECVSRL